VVKGLSNINGISTSFGICLRLCTGSALCELAGVHGSPAMGEMPDEFLQLIISVLGLQELDQQLYPQAAIADELAAHWAQIRVAGVEDVKSEQSAKIGDGLFRRWHVTLGKGAEHLIAMDLLVQSTLTTGVIIVAGKERFRFCPRHDGRWIEACVRRGSESSLTEVLCWDEDNRPSYNKVDDGIMHGPDRTMMGMRMRG
jgi:hypothetical protein